MKYKERIYEAWQFTQNNKKMIVWYGFLPAFLTTIVGILYVVYQILAFKSSPLFDDATHSFFYEVTSTIFNFIRDNFSISVPLIVSGIILLIIYLLLPILLDASMIQVIARRRNGQKVSLPEGLKYGMLRFLPLFEYSLIMRTFSLIICIMKDYKQKVSTSVKKASSLLKRIDKMLEEDKYCIDIIQQILAVIGIMRGANRQLLEGHLNACFKKALKTKDSKKQTEMVNELIRVMGIAQKK